MGAGLIVEEPAPAPHEQPIGAVPPQRSFHEETAPMPRERTPPPARFWMPGAPHDSSLPDLESLHREIENLRMEREALLLEEVDLITAKDFHAAKSSQADLQKRVVELLAKAAQQTKKNETAPASLPVKGQGVEDRGQGTESRGRKSGVGPAPATPTAPLVQPPQPTHPLTSAKPSDESKHSLETKSDVVTDVPVDPLALAQSLFRAGDYAAALNAYRKLDKEDQKPEDRITIQYMMACCLRKLGKANEASMLYREVANSIGNEFLMENAQWHLRGLKDRRELEAQLDELRQRSQAVKPRKP